MVRIACTIIVLCGSLFAQVASNVVGTITDSTGAAAVGVKVELTSSLGAARSADTNAEGQFRFNNIAPGTYSVSIAAPGFKSYSQKNLNLASSETRDLGRITLEIGTVMEEVSVVAQATAVQTASSEKSSLIDATQLSNVALKGRDVAGMLQMLPGITGADGGETSSVNSLGRVSINGGGEKNIMYDGVNVADSGNGSGTQYSTNMDAVQEIRVLAANYAAEYGRNASGSISVVTKGGSPEFHGSGWWNKRHESFNANSFFNNRSNTARSIYRYNIYGFSVGGPAYIPKLFNTKKDKFFFFVSQEYTKQKPSTSVNYYKMPTALERNGDFSQTTTSTGALLVIKDPLANSAPFPGNKIDPARFDATGKAILNFFPLPNYTEVLDPTQIYSRNYKKSSIPDSPQRNDIVRIDANASSKLNAYFRYGHDYVYRKSLASNFDVVNSAGQRDAYWKSLDNSGNNYAFGATYTFSPTTVNEVVVGKGYTQWNWDWIDYSQVTRDKMGNPPHWYDASKLPTDKRFYAEYIPYVTFSGGQLANAPSVGEGNINDAEPRKAMNYAWTLNESVSKVTGSHSFKAGLYYEHTSKLQGKGSYYNGYFNFGHSTDSTLTTENGFANALLGYVQQYQEGNKTVYDVAFQNLEIFAQDSWRVTRRLTLDLGLRLYTMPPWVDRNNTFSTFVPGAWNAANAPRLYTYGKNAAGKVIAVDPLDPTNVKASAYAGLYVTTPSGSVIGDPANGWKRQGDPSLPSGMFKVRNLLPAVRVGFAWDVSGNGKTAVRGGFGQFYNRGNMNQIYEMTGLPPVGYVPQVYYLTMSELATTTKALGPLNTANFITGNQNVEGAMNGSFGIQRNLGFGTVVDVSYVGAFARHRLARWDLNHIGLFAQFDPANANPTNTSKALPDNFFRPYKGLGPLNSGEYASTSNYNSLQVSMNRRYSKGLQYGLAYTFSKTIAVNPVSYYFDAKMRNRAPSGTPHLLVINYSYDLPGLGARFGNKALGAVLDNWILSGITTFNTGGRTTPSFSYTSTVNQTGSAESARIDRLADHNLSASERTFYRQFNTEAFAAPKPCSWANRTMACFGNGGSGYMYSPSWNNWDMTLAKTIPLGMGERRVLRFRGEFYNIFNHTQFSGFGTSAQYNLASGARVTTGSGASFGQLTGARNPRQVSFTLRLEF